jgi:flavorubredoxin
MKAKPITPDIFWVGAINRESRFFDNLIPIPSGTSYNSYLVRGSEKTVLIDTVDPPFVDHLFARLDDLGVTTIDYVVANHAEQDHSGCLPDVLLAYPEARVLCSAKCKSMLVDHLHLDADRIDEVQDGDRLPIGGDVLEFLSTPWVHWPETIMTWLPEHRILFPCDFFGSHMASESLFVSREAEFLNEAKRYYAQIMMPFSGAAKKYTERVRSLKPAVIAPSHGPVIDKTQIILDAYTNWTSGIPKNKATVVYVSMHGSTRLMIEHLVDALIQQGIEIHCFPVVESDLGRIAMELVDSATLILGTPSVLGGPHPHIAMIAYLTNMLKPKVLNLAVVGSFGWGNKLMSELAPLISSLKAEVMDPVLLKGLPDAEALHNLDRLAEAIAERHKSIN